MKRPRSTLPLYSDKRLHAAWFDTGHILDLVRNAARLPNNNEIMLPNGRRVRVSRALRTFARWGCSCPRCGLVGTVFFEYLHQGQGRGLSNLVLAGRKRNGRWRMFGADHIVPKAHGGSGSIGNLQPLCTTCNHAKDDAWDGQALPRWRLANLKDWIVANVAADHPGRARYLADYIRSHETAAFEDLGVNLDAEEFRRYRAEVLAAYGIAIPPDATEPSLFPPVHPSLEARAPLDDPPEHPHPLVGAPAA